MLIGSLLITAITFSAEAQIRRNTQDSLQNNIGRNEHPRRGGHKAMPEKMQLTDEQKQQMKSINADFKSKIVELEKSNLTAEELTARKKALMQERKQKTSALLTSEQKDKLKQFKKEHHSGKMGSAQKMEKMQEKLGLSNDQVEKIKAQRETYNAKQDAIKSNQNLSAEQKNEQLKVLREERKNSFKSLLTSEQIKKMEELKQKKGRKTA